MNLFYVNSEEVRPPHIRIRGQEAKHISKVMRYRTGDHIMVSDGSGNKYECQIGEITRSELNLKILNTKVEERPKPFLTICIGNIKKRDRLEFAVEKMTELGADRIIVFKGEHSQKESVRMDRLEASALAAMKQSLRVYLPQIVVEKSLQKAFTLLDDHDQLLMADEIASHDNSTVRAFEEHENKSIFIVIGPEGGFSEKERELLANRNAGIVSLGPKRLRTETAAIIATDRFKNRI